jgi:hypothetical protein
MCSVRNTFLSFFEVFSLLTELNVLVLIFVYIDDLCELYSIYRKMSLNTE